MTDLRPQQRNTEYAGGQEPGRHARRHHARGRRAVRRRAPGAGRAKSSTSAHDSRRRTTASAAEAWDAVAIHAATPGERLPTRGRAGRPHPAPLGALGVGGADVAARCRRSSPLRTRSAPGSPRRPGRRRADGEAAPAPPSGAGACVARDRVGRGPGLVQDPCPERPHLGPLPGGCRGDEAATFGRLGPAVDERDQRPALQLPREQHRASDGGAGPGHRGLDQHTRLTVCNTRDHGRGRRGEDVG